MRFTYFKQRICTFSIALLRHTEKCICIGNYPSKVIQFCECNNVLWFKDNLKSLKLSYVIFYLYLVFKKYITSIENKKYITFVI